eukprot:1314001-Pyramimonas_sp.AAC.1
MANNGCLEPKCESQPALSPIFSLPVIGVCYGYIHSPLLRLVSATGIFSLPFCDWCLLRVHSLSPSAIGARYGVGDPLVGVGRGHASPVFASLASRVSATRTEPRQRPSAQVQSIIELRKPYFK